MTISNHVTFAPQGLLALAPQAYGMPFEVLAQCVEARGDVALVPIRGPLMQHIDTDPKAPPLRSYESIKADVRAALAARPKAVVLSISSPGGLVSGCFECSTELREMAAAAGVPLIAYVDGQACSAAYALACACERIIAPATADVGSIGVIAGLVDATRQAAAMGMRFVVVASGARKADGNPMAEITPAAVEAKQAHVDEVAELFFEHVAAARPITADAVRGFEGAFFTGQTALRLHLVDAVQTLDQLLASLNAPASTTSVEASENKSMTMKEAAQAILDDDKASEDEKKEAKTYLAKCEEGDGTEKAEDSDEDKPEDKPEDQDKAEAGDDDIEGDKPAKKDDDKAKAVAAVDPLKALADDVATLKARDAARVEASARRKVFATRPDLTKEQLAGLAGVPTAALAATLGAIPKGKAAPASPMAASLAAVKGGVAGDPPADALTPERLAQRKRMGLAASSGVDPIRIEGDKFVFSVDALAQSKAAKSGKVVAQ